MSDSFLSIDEKNALRKKCFDDLYFFAKAILGFDWLDPDIHIPLCRLLESYHKNRRLRILLPRGWLKTTLCSQAYPVWRAIRNPNIRVLLAQNTFTNAVAKLRVIRSVFDDNKLFQALFPELLPDSRCVWSAESLCIKRPKQFDESTFEAAGTRTQITSRHYDIIIEDDTVAPSLDELGEQTLCPSKDDVDQAIGWHRLVPPLLVNPMESQIIVVGTRWFEKDLLSWVEDNEKHYKSYVRACLETNGVPDEFGTPSYPQRFNLEVLNELKNSCGPYLFQCLYLNSPTRSEDMVFHFEWIKYYDVEPEPHKLVVYTTVDLASDPTDTKGGNNDFNTVVTTGKDLVSGRIFVLEYFRKRCSPGELIDAIFSHVRKWRPIKVGVESVAYQSTLQYWIRERKRTENLYFFVEGFTHGRRSKESRIVGLQPLVFSGNLLFRANMVELVNELLSFPNGATDDIVDALASQTGLWAQTRSQIEAKAEENNDPLGFDAALEELSQRNLKYKEAPMDLLNVA